MATRTPLLVSLKDAAGQLGCSYRHLTNLVRRGHVPVTRLGRRVLVHRDDLEKLARVGTPDGA